MNLNGSALRTKRQNSPQKEEEEQKRADIYVPRNIFRPTEYRERH